MSSASCYCWFIWEKGFTGEPIIRWIKGDNLFERKIQCKWIGLDKK